MFLIKFPLRQITHKLTSAYLIHSNWVQIEIFAFFHVFGDFLVGIRNVPRAISYKAGHSRVSLRPPCSRIIYSLESSHQYWKEIFCLSVHPKEHHYKSIDPEDQ